MLESEKELVQKQCTVLAIVFNLVGKVVGNAILMHKFLRFANKYIKSSFQICCLRSYHF